MLAAGAFVAATVQSAAGLGFALLLGPIAFALLEPADAIVLVTVLGATLSALVLAGERRRPRVAWREVGPMLAAAAPGAVAGVLVLRALPAAALQLAVGAAVVAAAWTLSRGSSVGAAVAGSRRGRLGVGFLSGALTTSVGVSGPPIALWLGARGFSPGAVRDSLAAVFVGLAVIAAMALAPLVIAGEARPPGAVVLAATGAVVAGHVVGRRLFARLRPARHQRLLLAVIALAGVASIVAGAVALLGR